MFLELESWSFIPWAEVGKGKGLEISIDQGFVSPEKRWSFWKIKDEEKQCSLKVLPECFVIQGVFFVSRIQDPSIGVSVQRLVRDPMSKFTSSQVDCRSLAEKLVRIWLCMPLPLFLKSSPWCIPKISEKKKLSARKLKASGIYELSILKKKHFETQGASIFLVQQMFMKLFAKYTVGVILSFCWKGCHWPTTLHIFTRHFRPPSLAPLAKEPNHLAEKKSKGTKEVENWSEYLVQYLKSMLFSRFFGCYMFFEMQSPSSWNKMGHPNRVC